MLATPASPTTSVLLLDSSANQRTYWADQLRRCSADYEIIEAADGQSALDLFRSRRIDCVVSEIALADQSGFEVLMTLVPRASRPHVAVIMLTQVPYRGLWELAYKNGARGCLSKHHTTGEELDKTIQRAVAFVGQLPKEDRYRCL
jgi:two-component system sporulation sensor kinase A